MNFKGVIIAYFTHKQNTGNKNNILCYNETFKGRADNAKQKRQSKHKKGAYYHGKQKHSSA
ncbi:restriction endonuclease subunit M [Helicobacter pylori]|uniref:restriction endonuclease subunit M n=1 Tax=Helicobacter pylori TaxID=210 RepID=UPI0009587ABA|nr:restriction endonuclease subunit M [Helicobacter pylori]BAW62708.1 type I restriction-modification system/DNA-methyltransferase subunit M [Helicobacter pylori]